MEKTMEIYKAYPEKDRVKIAYITGGAIIEAKSLYVEPILQAVEECEFCYVDKIEDYQHVAIINIRYDNRASVKSPGVLLVTLIHDVIKEVETI